MSIFRPSVAVVSTLALYLGFLMLGGLVVAIFVTARIQSNSYGEVRRLAVVKDHLQGLFSAVQDIETSQRGYVLTGDEAYLTVRTAALPVITSELNVLAPSFRNDPKEFAVFANLIAQKIDVNGDIVKLREAGKNDEALALIIAGKGQSVMNLMRTSHATLIVSQDKQIATALNLADRVSDWLRGGALVAGLLILILAAISFNLIHRQVGLFTAGRDDLLLANTKLLDEGVQQKKLSGQLRQAQKMEALGQLTGGLAHDLNNMLAVIVSSLSIGKRQMARGETDIHRYLDSALDGAERAASLTGRLMAFSRQQPLSPALLNPNKIVSEMSELLLRTLGEAVHLETILAGGLWRTFVDGSQIENTILNLALNARDAMSGKRKLTIETSNAHLSDEYVRAHQGVSAGQYVLIAVTDTGMGMSPAVVEKVFDPFFTTKPTGKGTGLGLSQVYGFVKQSGGHIAVYSEPGHGTTFKLYLPRSYLDEVSETPAIAGASVPIGDASEIILVVEDDMRVRHLTVESLRELGYTVLHADGGAAALQQLEVTPHVDLLFTDIVMPDMDGRELAAEATRRDPELKVLYTSGYLPNAVVHNATLGPL